MSSQDKDLSIIDVENPPKRVRWSDDFSIENETEAVSTELQSLHHTKESKSKALHCDNIKGASNSLPEFCDDKNNKQATITGDSSEVDCSVQSGEKSISSVVSDPPPIGDNNNALDVLIYETEHMSICSDSKQAEEVSSSEQVMKRIFLFTLTYNIDKYIIQLSVDNFEKYFRFMPF